ncbi:hypothetical protein NPIL_113101 [Nephila pilipes]|uniref:Uncharacterized protein n=1 Tax=Nephila pilipes TaxID=299642 RepID=A0A8X6UBC2_NEPPI|nr:hypothetical protein NPIL_113101 [Nephila pilipes]
MLTELNDYGNSQNSQTVYTTASFEDGTSRSDVFSSSHPVFRLHSLVQSSDCSLPALYPFVTAGKPPSLQVVPPPVIAIFFNYTCVLTLFCGQSELWFFACLNFLKTFLVLSPDRSTLTVTYFPCFKIRNIFSLPSTIL